MSTQFDAVGYIITLYSSKSYVKSWGCVEIFGRSWPPTPSGCAHVQGGHTRSIPQNRLHNHARMYVCL